MKMMDHINKLLLSELLGQMCVCELQWLCDGPEHPGTYDQPLHKPMDTQIKDTNANMPYVHVIDRSSVNKKFDLATTTLRKKLLNHELIYILYIYVWFLIIQYNYDSIRSCDDKVAVDCEIKKVSITTYIAPQFRWETPAGMSKDIRKQ